MTEELEAIEETTAEATAEAGSEATEPRMFSQEEVNKMVGQARIKERSKYQDYDALKEKADQFEHLKEENATQLEELNSWKNKATSLEQANELRTMTEEVANAYGLNSSILRGSTREELTAHAEAIKACMPVSSPALNVSARTAPSLSKADILAIENDKERMKAIASNLELFQ